MADQEGYQGTKFKTNPVGEAPTDYRIEELIYWCGIFNDYNLAPPYPDGSYGNLSFRVEDEKIDFIITTSRTGLGALRNECFARVCGVDFGRRVIDACVVKGKEPSSESMVHFVIYRERPEINAVFHGHSPEILAAAEKLGILITGREVPYGTRESVEEVISILKSESFLAMKNHGFLALGRTMQEAGELTMRMYRQSVRALGILASV